VRTWLLSTALALGPATGPSRVEIDASGLEHHMPEDALHRFHGELLMRLLEAGHGVGDEGSVVLSLTSAGDAIVVECRIAERRERIEVDDADAAVLGLELVHRAVDLVERCTAVAGASSDGMLIDSDGSLDASELLVELASMPITLVLDEHAAVWRLCVRERLAFVVAIERGCETASELVVLDPRAAIDDWRASTTEPPSPIEPPEPSPEPPPSVSEPSRSPAWGLSVGAAAGVQLRFAGVAASVQANVAALHRRGAFIGAAGSIAPSRAEQLAVIDGLGLATVGWRGAVSKRVVLRPSLGIGVAVHRFRYDDDPIGHRFDLALRVPLEIELRLAARLFASVAVAGTVGTRRIEHTFGDSLLWTRGVLRLDALIGLRFDWIEITATPAARRAARR
jgi:hypothetical protein